MDEKQTLELELKTSIEKGIQAIGDLSKELTKVSTNIGTASGAASKFGSVLKSAFSVVSVKKLASEILGFLDNSINRAEELNLFNVIFKNTYKNGKQTFSDLGREATKFQNRLNEAFGTNKTETMRYQGLFQSMGENAGIKAEYASIMSENMTKLTYDLASLYNKSEKSVAEALRAGVYAGQTKPLRNFGIDVTQTSLTPILSQIGITDRTISQMSMAEKEILRYIAVLNQGKIAMGDFADTIESPANQLKIFRNQIAEVKVAIGDLFMGLFSKILPYVNAILMVIKEIAKAIARAFGIETRDYNTGLADLEEIYDGIGESANKAGKATKELKRQILGFDQINNLTTPSKNSSGVGAAAGFGSIDKRLLQYIKEYDNLMEKVKSKATEIRDRIMEWLGFTRYTNEETDETYFKFERITSGTVLGALGVGGVIFVGIMKIIKAVKGLGTIFSILTGGGAKTGLLGLLTGSGGTASATGGISSLLGGASIGTIAATASAVLAVVGAVVFLVASLKKAWTESEEFRNAFNSAWNSVGKLLSKIGELVEKVATTIGKVLEPAWKALKKTVDWVTDTAYENIRFKYEAAFELISGICDSIVLLIDGDVIGAYNRWGETIDTVRETLSNGYKKIVANTLTTASDILRTIKEEIVDKIPEKIEEIRKKIDTFLFETIPTKLGEFVGKVLSIDWVDVGRKVKDKIFEGLSEFKDKVVEWAKKMADKLKKSFDKNGDGKTGAYETISGIGKKIMDAIWSGITSPYEKAKQWAQNFVKGLKAGLGGKSSNTSMQSAIDAAIEASLKKANGGVFNGTSWSSIPQYANGGSPHGTMFIAGESGAEIVGNINGRTEVLNKSQIASSIYHAVLSAMNSASRSTQVELVAHTDEGVIIDRINQRTSQTGVCPINIPY
jgi:hypothetical protein